MGDIFSIFVTISLFLAFILFLKIYGEVIINVVSAFFVILYFCGVMGIILLFSPFIIIFGGIARTFDELSFATILFWPILIPVYGLQCLWDVIEETWSKFFG